MRGKRDFHYLDDRLLEFDREFDVNDIIWVFRLSFWWNIMKFGGWSEEIKLEHALLLIRKLYHIPSFLTTTLERFLENCDQMYKYSTDSLLKLKYSGLVQMHNFLVDEIEFDT
jgi:hypothetical protein